MTKQVHPILKLDQICFSVRKGFLMRSTPILYDICLEVNQGSVLGLIGANGAGKTTTLNIASGLIQPDKGNVKFKGDPIHNAQAKKKLGFLAEIQHPFKYIKIKEWFHMLGKLSGLHGVELKDRIEEIISIFELEDLSSKFLHLLSKGQLQRVNFAQALLHGPEILILDEPMSGLDAYWRHHVLSFLKLYKNQGGSIIFSSHVLTDVKEIADKIACIDHGRIQWVSDSKSIETYLEGIPNNKNFNKVLFKESDYIV